MHHYRMHRTKNKLKFIQMQFLHHNIFDCIFSVFLFVLKKYCCQDKTFILCNYKNLRFLIDFYFMLNSSGLWNVKIHSEIIGEVVFIISRKCEDAILVAAWSSRRRKCPLICTGTRPMTATRQKIYRSVF